MILEENKYRPSSYYFYHRTWGPEEGDKFLGNDGTDVSSHDAVLVPMFMVKAVRI
jgi:hypothetical protein